VLETYFRNLYQRTMREAYGLAFKEIAHSLGNGGRVLDCGASNGSSFERLRGMIPLDASRYRGIEWSEPLVREATAKGLDVVQGDLNRPLPFGDGEFRCVFGLSVLEHLLNGCAFMRESHRLLEERGTLVLLTPNISTFFTIALLLAGKMPSSGPHPDSSALVTSEEVYKVSHPDLLSDAESDTPVHRHLVVFSYRVLGRYLRMTGFEEVRGFGFGLYPFPNMLQPLLEKLDPIHCHQMVFVARKRPQVQSDPADHA
jgi:hypothetical protein